ncbi:MAG: hypothetical protein J2P36_12610 [Ktedonobacteraceae bacterium]|nr:hypothetical protein [Ktedonobacteraceae bacterium]
MSDVNFKKVLAVVAVGTFSGGLGLGIGHWGSDNGQEATHTPPDSGTHSICRIGAQDSKPEKLSFTTTTDDHDKLNVKVTSPEPADLLLTRGSHGTDTVNLLRLGDHNYTTSITTDKGTKVEIEFEDYKEGKCNPNDAPTRRFDLF